MFGYNDKLTLTAVNVINKDGEIIDYNLSFPIDEDNFSIPKDIIQMSIFEYHEEREITGYEAFKIYVGKTTSIRKICESEATNVKFKNNLIKKLDSPDDKICYFDDSNGNHIMFSKINKGDIVVDNNDELKDALIYISNKFQNIKDSSLEIRRINADSMEKQVRNAMKFYLLATKLKYKIRSGWDDKHWNVSSERIESIAEHVYGTCILAISLDSEFQLNMDMEKVLKMLTIHEIGEVLIGDITPFDKITQKEKEELEHEAMRNVLSDLYNKEELFSLLIEFDEHNTKESKFAYLCDKMEANIQAKVYQDMGYQNSLDNQENNVVFKNPKIQAMIENGAQTAFDIWYEWDKAKFEGEPVFQKTLSFIKKNNTNI